MTACNALPKDTVIFEDSHIGRQGALDSKAHLIAIENRNDLNQEKGIDEAELLKVLSQGEKRALYILNKS
jgi:beta-phosphoglucomutase-like phosphatase (HAD superfamily)